MKKGQGKSSDFSELRGRAEKQLRKRTPGPCSGIPRGEDDARRLLHELQVHQVELELQNEELRRAKEAAEDALHKYTELYDLAPAGYFTLDEYGIIREVNLTGATMLRKERSLLEKRHFTLFVANGDRSVFDAFLQNVFRENSKESCEVRLQKDGEDPLFVYVKAMGLTVKGRCNFVMVDITERKKAEEKLKARTQELESLNKELEAYSSAVSLELRTPLRSVQRFGEIILEDHAKELSEAVKDYLQRVISASHRMDQLIHALLKMSRLTRRELRGRTVYLGAMAKAIAGELRRKDPRRKSTFVINENVAVKADMSMLEVVIENLLDNAWKFTSKHPSAKIEFGTVRRDGKDVYFVRDDGAGFDMAYSDKLFLPFKRLHPDSEFPGVGIGLAIAQRIVMRHGGRMWAEGAPEKGATFYFTLG